MKQEELYPNGVCQNISTNIEKKEPDMTPPPQWFLDLIRESEE